MTTKCNNAWNPRLRLPYLEASAFAYLSLPIECYIFQCSSYGCVVRFHSHCSVSERYFHAICQCKYLEKCSNMSLILAVSFQRTSPRWLYPGGDHLVACFRIYTTGGAGRGTLCLHRMHTVHIHILTIAIYIGYKWTFSTSDWAWRENPEDSVFVCTEKNYKHCFLLTVKQCWAMFSRRDWGEQSSQHKPFCWEKSWGL